MKFNRLLSARTFCVVALAFAAVLASAQERVRTRLDVTSEPEGATVVVDGVEKGVTPLVLHDLAPGNHHVRCRLQGYVDSDAFVSMREGSRIDRHETLEAETGLLLVKTEPEGCNIKVDGVSIGETPMFVANLTTKDVHKVRLSKAGYQDQTISVKFNGREPLVREERMILDSGALDIISDPAGAEVTVNGIVRGRTPLAVEKIPKGTATVKIRLDGFKEDVREVRMNAGDRQTLSVLLVGYPGTLHLISVPPGARFYLNGEARGQSPVSIPSLQPGEYEVRCEKEGFGSVTRTVEIKNGASAREEFRLSSVMGRVEVRTTPPGAEILLDGRKVGYSKASGGEAVEKSDIFPIEEVLEGEHVLLVRKDGYQEVSRTIRVESKKTSRQHNIILKRAFVPDIEVTTATEVIRGVFKSKNDEVIIIERTPGTDYPIPLRTVRKIESLAK